MHGILGLRSHKRGLQLNKGLDSVIKRIASCFSTGLFWLILNRFISYNVGLCVIIDHIFLMVCYHHPITLEGSGKMFVNFAVSK
jgi:hypothetical protein